MSWSQLDIAFKTLLNKRQSDSNKEFYEEFGDFTINTHEVEIWSDLIPSDASSLANVIEYYDLHTLIVDTTVPGNLTWAAVTNPGSSFNFALADDPTNPRLKDWISDKYGSGYDLQLYSNGSQIAKTSTTYPWRFNYATGELTFNSASPATPIQIRAYRYIGRKGFGTVYLKEASLGSSFVWDGSILDVSIATATGDVTQAYVDGSLATRDTSISDILVQISVIDSSIEYLKSKDASIDSSLNLIWVKFGYADASLNDIWSNFSNYETKVNLDSSFNDVYTEIDTKADLTYIDSSLLVRDADLAQLDSSIIRIDTKLSNVDTSLNDLWIDQISQDTAISNLQTKDTNIDSSLNNLWSNFSNYETKVNLDSSFNDIYSELDLKSDLTYVDSSLLARDSLISANTSEISQLDSSIIILRTKDTYIDTSLNELWVQVYAFEANDVTFAYVDGSINYLRSKDASIDVSLNALWSNFSNYETKVNLDSSFNNVHIEINLKSDLTYVDGSLNYIKATYIPDVSLSNTYFVWNTGLLEVSAGGGDVTQAYVDGSLATRDASITDLYNTKVDNATNIGIGDASIFASKSGTTLQFKKLVGSGAATVTDGTNTVTIGLDASFAGEVNSGENIGDGVGVFAEKVGDNLQFKSLSSSDNTISFLTDNANIYLDVSIDYVSQSYVDSSLLVRDAEIAQLDASVIRIDASLITVLTSLSDVSITSVSTGDFLKYDSSWGVWFNVSSSDASIYFYTKDEIDSSFNDVYTELNLKADLNYVDGSLLIRDAEISQLDVSVIRIDSKLINIDTSLNELWIDQLSQDTDITNLQTKDTNIDTSLNNIWSNFSNYETKVNLDSSFNDVYTEIDTKADLTYVDGSLNYIKATYIPDVSLNDTYFIWNAGFLEVSAGGGDVIQAYVDASLLARDAEIAQLDASVIRIDTKLSNIDISLNDIWIDQLSQDASIVNLRAKDSNIDVSLNSLWTNFDNYETKVNLDSSFNDVWAELNLKADLTYVDSSLSARDSLISINTANIAQLDASIIRIDAELNDIDTSLNDIFYIESYVNSSTYYDGSLNYIKASYIPDVSLNDSYFVWNAGLLEVSAGGGDVTQAYVDASLLARDAEISQLDSSVIRIDTKLSNVDTSLNELWIDQFSQDSSITELRSKDASIDVSLNSLWSNFDNYETKVNLDSSFNDVYTQLDLKVEDATNIGTGDASVFASKSGTTLQFKKLVGSGAATITDGTETITIGLDASFAGEVNTASNIGSGIGVFAEKVGDDLQFKSLSSSDNTIAISSTATDIFIDASFSGGLSVIEVSSNYTASNNQLLLVDVTDSSIDITLPLSSTTGDIIQIVDVVKNSSTNNIYVKTNGHTIDESADDFIIDVNGGSIEFIYESDSDNYSIINLEGLSNVLFGDSVSKSYVDSSLNNKLDKNLSFKEASANYTLIESDNGLMIDASGTFTLTLPDNLNIGFQFAIINLGIGEITLDASSILSYDSSVKLIDQYAGASATHRGNGVWYAFGNLK